MVNTVTVNGNLYSDDSSTGRYMGNGGHRVNLIPMFSDAVVDLAGKVASAADSQTSCTASATSASANAATASADAATASAAATSATASQLLAADWATKLGSPVSGGEYSAKYWAQYAGSLATGQLILMGDWDASSGSYPGSPVKGAVWKVSVAGTVSGTTYAVNDYAIYNGTSWDKINNQSASIVYAASSVAVTPNRTYNADTNAAPITLTLPASPVAGDTVVFMDARGTWGTNNLTIALNGQSFETPLGEIITEDLICDIDRAALCIVFNTYWRFI